MNNMDGAFVDEPDLLDYILQNVTGYNRAKLEEMWANGIKAIVSIWGSSAVVF